jgi:ATP-dependent exoDNAse (exonuclease V) beta subunit
MLKAATQTLFSASAGSGKTHRLVQSYLYLCLKEDNPRAFFDILAITFTRKATAEMKERIVHSLQEWTSGQSSGASKVMRDELKKQLELSDADFDRRASKLLQSILHHYGYFSVTTIDALTHRIVRGFAQDLNLSPGFELEMDRELLVKEATERLLDEYGEKKEVSRFLKRYAHFLNQEEEKDWKVFNKLVEQANNFMNASQLDDLWKLAGDEIESYEKKIKKLSQAEEQCKDELHSHAELALKLIDDKGLTDSDFFKKFIPKFFSDAANASSHSQVKDLNATSEKQLNQEVLPYVKSMEGTAKGALIDALIPALKDHAFAITSLQSRWTMLLHIRQNIYGIALLGRIRYHLQNIQTERNLILMDELSVLISRELREQSSAYLFERLGERYKQLFIDEFQDTSRMQWENLSPFTEDILGGGGQVLLVGDAKQAIYRWRGGDVQQFMEIYHKSKNEHEGYALEELAENWRSLPLLVDFNNAFFRFCSEYLNVNPLHQLLYEGSHQIAKKQAEGGFVQIHRSVSANEDEFSLEQDEEIISLVRQLTQEKGYRPMDIALLFRSKKTANRLIPKLLDAGFEVASEQGELMNQNPECVFLIDLLRLNVDAENVEATRAVLKFFITSERISIDDAEVFAENLNKKNFWKALAELYPEIAKEQLALGTHELLQHWIRVFHLHGQADSYIWRLLSECIHRGSKQSMDAVDIIRWWDERGHAIPVEQAEREEALRMMTIHKSKGLQFPIVIMPDSKWATSKLTDNFLWTNLDKEKFAGFERFPFQAKKWDSAEGELKEHWETSVQNTLLDHINMLYVSFTRAEECLYIFTHHAKAEHKNIGGLIQSFLESQGYSDESTITWGIENDRALRLRDKDQKKESVTEASTANIQMKSREWQDSIRIAVRPMFSEEQEFGKRFHEKAIQCELAEDWQKLAEEEPDFQDAISSLLEKLKQEEYAIFFKGWRSLNERSISDSYGKILRPDRVVIDPLGKIHILDYKTGAEKPKYQEQIDQYKLAYEEAGFQVGSARLLYI